MSKGVKVTLLTLAGIVLLVSASLATSYERSLMAALEQILGFLLLLVAGGICLVGMGDPVETQPPGVAPKVDHKSEPAPGKKG